MKGAQDSVISPTDRTTPQPKGPRAMAFDFIHRNVHNAIIQEHGAKTCSHGHQ